MGALSAKLHVIHPFFDTTHKLVLILTSQILRKCSITMSHIRTKRSLSTVSLNKYNASLILPSSNIYLKQYHNDMPDIRITTGCTFTILEPWKNPN